MTWECSVFAKSLFFGLCLFLATSSSQAQPDCRDLFQLSSIEKENRLTNSIKGSVSLSTAERLTAVLDSLPAEARNQLFSLLKNVTAQQAAVYMQGKDIPANIQSLLKEQPELEQVFADFMAFSEIFPGILQLGDAQTWTSKVLKSILAQERRPKHSNAKILESQGTAPRLRRNINSNIANLIQQATVSYLGMEFNTKGVNPYWFKIKRFFFPLYNQVRKQVDAGQFYQRQLERLRVVDALVIREILTDHNSVLLSSSDLEAATALVLDSPSEISSIEDSLKQIYGNDFSATSGVAIGDFDIYKGAKVVDTSDLSAIQDSFETNNIDSLDKMNTLINVQREKSGQAPRTMTDKTLDELRIYHEAQNRRVWRWSARYENITDQDSNESYTVEDRHERQVPDGKDDKGNTKYRTEVYYTTRRVTPSFEDILSDSYDTGDRMVSGLNAIKEDAAQVVERESIPRAIIAEADDLIQNTVKNYTAIVSQGKGRDKVENNIKAMQKQLEQEIADQRKYAKWSNSAILSQYENDDVSNFKERNQWLLNRLENASKELTTLSEFMRRNQLQLILSFDEMDFNPWMRTLKSYRNWNYFYKTAITLSGMGGGGFTAYQMNPEFALWVNQHGVAIMDMFQRLTGQ
jgi:hypothetical protein